MDNLNGKILGIRGDVANRKKTNLIMKYIYDKMSLKEVYVFTHHDIDADKFYNGLIDQSRIHYYLEELNSIVDKQKKNPVNNILIILDQFINFKTDFKNMCEDLMKNYATYKITLLIVSTEINRDPSEADYDYIFFGNYIDPLVLNDIYTKYFKSIYATIDEFLKVYADNTSDGKFLTFIKQ